MTQIQDYMWDITDTHEFMKRTAKSTMPPCIITVAINGGIQGKEVNDGIPETADDIAASAEEAYKAGASVIHIHCRDPNKLWGVAKTTDHWLEVNRKVRERCPDIIINNTTGGGPDMTLEERLQCLPANPEMCSLNIVPDMGIERIKARDPPIIHPHPALEYNDTVPYTYASITKAVQEMNNYGIKPELEIWHTGANYVIDYLRKNGLIQAPYYIQTVMGYQTASFPTPAHMLELVRDFPKPYLWLTSGIGPYQLQLTTFAILMGGHVRVGLEDNVYYGRGRKAKSNAELVARTVRICKELNRPVATPQQARGMIGISLTPSTYD